MYHRERERGWDDLRVPLSVLHKWRRTGLLPQTAQFHRAGYCRRARLSAWSPASGNRDAAVTRRSDDVTSASALLRARLRSSVDQRILSRGHRVLLVRKRGSVCCRKNAVGINLVNLIFNLFVRLELFDMRVSAAHFLVSRFSLMALACRISRIFCDLYMLP